LAYHQPFQITGFHSCDKEVGLRVLNGEINLVPSDNTWDWLGGGIYFWEQNPARALEYAKDCASGNQKNKTGIKTPFVIGAVIELGNCLNLLEPISLSLVKQSYDSLKTLYEDLGEPMPVNKGANRALDCAVIKYVHETRKRLVDEPPFDTIRSAFLEGQELYPTSNFTTKLHIEICVIKPELIKGYFLPVPIEEFNPYLNKE
jgi:hypothetical protein